VARQNRSGLPEHCSWNYDRHGKRRVRFRKGGFSTYLTGTPWSDDFMAQYAAALDGVKAQSTEIGKDRTIPGSVDALAVSYYKLVFPRLKISTQAERRWIIERFRGEHGTKPVRILKREHIAAIIAARSETPHAANNLLKTLHTLFEHAVAVNMITGNPAADVKKFRIQSDGFHPWTEAEVAQFLAYHPVGSRARLALAMLLTGQRRSDVVRMGWQHIAGGAIAVKQEKTGARLLIPLDIDPLLPESLASVPKTSMTFLVTKYGAPFTPAGFSNWFRLKCDEAGLPQCSAHGLRKLVATRASATSVVRRRRSKPSPATSRPRKWHATQRPAIKNASRKVLQASSSAAGRTARKANNICPTSRLGWTKQGVSN
jgi:integrase